jgi:hypothetical protein
MANDVLSDEQIAEMTVAIQANRVYYDPPRAQVLTALRELQHRRAQENSSLPGTLAAVQAQPFCRLCVGQGRIYVGTEWRLCSCQPQPVSARPDPAWMQAQRAIQERDATGSHPLRDETREPDTAGRVELEQIARETAETVHPCGMPYTDAIEYVAGVVLAALQRARETGAER